MGKSKEKSVPCISISSLLPISLRKRLAYNEEWRLIYVVPETDKDYTHNYCIKERALSNSRR